MIRTSGRGNTDLGMLSIPLALLIVYAIYSGGGLHSVLRTFERTLWVVVDGVVRLFSYPTTTNPQSVWLDTGRAATNGRVFKFEHHSSHPRPQVVRSRPRDSGIRARAGALHHGPASRCPRAHLFARLRP